MIFLRQIRFEIKNILKSKFIMIVGILVAVTSVLLPVLNFFLTQRANDDMVRPLPMPIRTMVREIVYSDVAYPGGRNQEPITVEGVTIQSDNPFYWQINGLMQEKDAMEIDKGRFSDSQVLDLALSMMDQEIEFYVHFAKHITKPMDYRIELAWMSIESLYDKFIYQHHDVPEDKLMEATNYRRGMDPESFKKKYIQITSEQRLAALDKLEDKLNTLFKVVENNDFPQYIDLRIKQENDNISSLKEQIAIEEENIIKNPSQEENISNIIDHLKKQITIMETSTIPILQLRLERNIIPGEDIWQNRTLSDIESSRNQLLYTEIISEEKFNQEMGLVQQYGNYHKYVSTMQAQRDELNRAILIGQRSLDANKPDMKYVIDGARSRTVQFLGYSVFVALFAILLGGWIMASEFQQGTIRLLMIRPKTRTKILMAKFLAAFAICLVIYISGSLLNLITNGICFGFSDYGYPNYTVSGEINFFAYYFPKFLACIIPIIFAFTVAFMLSVVIKNAAVSIAVPAICFIGCSILMDMFTYSKAMNWVIYTPIPFVQMSSFFVRHSAVKQIVQRGIPLSLSYGIILLLVLSAVCTIVSISVFNKSDIKN
jgi:ABC-2 type transport system permease protein